MNKNKTSLSVTITEDTRSVDNWIKGEVNKGEAKFSAKVFDDGSEYGIREGRVSKLNIQQNGKFVVNYDRGWDIKPQTPSEKALYRSVMATLNGLDKAFEAEKPKSLLVELKESKLKVKSAALLKRENPRGLSDGER